MASLTTGPTLPRPRHRPPPAASGLAPGPLAPLALAGRAGGRAAGGKVSGGAPAGGSTAGEVTGGYGRHEASAVPGLTVPATGGWAGAYRPASFG